MKNPVLTREIHTMFRSYKTFIAIGAYGIAMLGITALILFNMIYNRYNGFDPQNILFLFCAMIAFQTGIVFLAVPGFSAGAISGERERQTLDLMLLTKMSSFTIVLGKLLSSLLLVCIMLIIAMPVYAIVFYYGGITIFELFIAFIFDFSYAMLIGSLSIFLSSVFKKTVTSTVLSYIVLIFYPVIITIITGILSSLMYYKYAIGEVSLCIQYFVLAINPIMSFVSIVDSLIGSDTISDVFYSRQHSADDLGFKVWHLSIILNFILTFLFVNISAIVINPIKKKRC